MSNLIVENDELDKRIQKLSKAAYERDPGDGLGRISDEDAQEIKRLIEQREVEARIDELTKLDAETEWGDWKTDKVNARACVLMAFKITDRLAQLKNAEPCGICGDGGHSAFACPNGLKKGKE